MSQTLRSSKRDALRRFVIAKRKKAKLRQVDVAKRLGRYQSYITNIETGQRCCGVDRSRRSNRVRSAGGHQGRYEEMKMSRVRRSYSPFQCAWRVTTGNLDALSVSRTYTD
jgi:hypothetical protein